MAVIDAKKSSADTSAISLLPSGSVLDGVMLPRYDPHKRIVDVMKAERMTIVDADRISGENVAIEFYNPDQTLKGRVNMKQALFNQKTGILRADQPVDLVSDQVSAHGEGLYYSLQNGKGFLLGPAVTRITTPPDTAMNVPPPLRSTALLGISIMPLFAAQPPIAAPAAADTESKAPAAAEANKQTREKLRADLDLAAETNREATRFLEEAELLSTQPVPVTPPEEIKPLEVKTGPTDTVVNCDGGMYFDSEGGKLVYLRNVHVTDPRFVLSGANELTIVFEKKAPAKTKEPKPSEGTPKPADSKDKKAFNMGGSGGGFGEVSKIIATGAVRILQKSPEPGKEPIEASGALFTYDVKTGEIVISGGYPWVKQGTYFSRAKQPNLTLRMLNSGSFSTEGNWEMGGPLDMKR